MSLQEKIKDETKKAMIAKDSVRTTTLRGLSAALTTEAIARKLPEITDDDAIPVLKRLVKQRKDSIDQFTKGNRPDLADAEKIELAIIESFLPASMSREEIMKIAVAKKAELGVTDKAKLGQFMGAVMKETKGMADGADVKSVVESLFQ